MAFVGIPGDPPGTPKITMKAIPPQPWYPFLPYVVAGGVQKTAPPAAPVMDPYPAVSPATFWTGLGYTFPLVYDDATGDWDRV